MNKNNRANDKILKQMAQLYIMFTEPYVVINNGISELKYRWTDDNAKSLYKKHEELLIYNILLVQKTDKAEL